MRSGRICSFHLARTLRRLALAALIASAGDVSSAVASSAPWVWPLARSGVETLALNWFERMRTGDVDRGRLSTEYSRQLTDDAVREMSKFLREHQYGATPRPAEVVLERSSGGQTFYLVKIDFPRGDAASLMFGFDAEGRITGINLMTMAGD